jgi:hypothetical protein
MIKYSLTAVLTALMFQSAAISATSKIVNYPEEVAALMSGRRYHVLVERLRRSLPPDFQLRIESARVETIGNKKFAFIRFDKQSAIEPVGTRTDLGEIIGEVKSAGGGDVEIGEIYFKPPAGQNTLTKY